MVCIMSPAKPKHEMKTDDKEIEAIEIDDDSATENTDDDNLKLETLFGGSIIGSKPLFNSKGETVFIIQGNTVVVFSVKTGELINKFEPARDKVIKIEFEIGNKDFLIGCTESGQIVKWKSKKGTIEQKIELKLPKLAKVTAFALVSLDYDDTGLKAIVVYKNPSRVQLLDFFDVKTGTKSKSHFTYDLNMAKVILKVNHELNFFALVQQHTVYVVNVKTWAANRMRNAHMVNVTCLEFHPKEEVIATGDATGKIMLWRNFYDSFPITSLYHWHHTQVNALEFSESGSSLYSSGNESVLVKWGLVRDDKSFLPRLPGNGVQLAICTNNAKLAVSLEDNSILIIGDDQSVETTLQLSSLIPKNKTNLPNFPIGFKLNPRNQSVLYNGRKGQIQFVSTYTKSLLYNMDIVAQNRLSDETSKILYDIRVTAADINIDWLATGEEFNDMEHTPEVRLKFWEYQKNTQNYALNTNFEIPHDGGFRLIKFSSPLGSDNLVCATVGLDNVLKVWALEDSDNIYKQGKTWGCVKKITYKYQPIESVSFSNDGSLLAAGFANNLCIYMVKNMELKFVLSTPSSYSGLINECFIGLPKEKSKKTTDNRKTILQSFIKSLESGDDKFVKSLSSDKKSPKPLNLNEKSKPNLHKQILQSSDLGFFQKILTFKKLSIPSKFSDKTVADKVLHRFNGKSHSLSKKLKQVPHKMQFKAKHKLNRLLPTHSNKFDEVASLLQFLNISKKSGQMNGFSNGVDKDDSSEIKTIPKETKKIVQIKHICFCSGEYAHLVVVCTENRVFIWNLLTLRLQNILKLSVEHVTFDPITNLIACFTRYNELYVFLPNTPIPVYYRKNMPRIEGAIWVPRRYPQSQSLSVNWQAISTLYFVTQKQEFVYLSGNQDTSEHVHSIVAHDELTSKGYSVFGALSTNRTSGVDPIIPQFSNFIGNPEKGAVQTVLDMSTHTMPPLKTFCNKFINSMIHIRSNTNSPKTNRPNSTAEVNGYSSDRLNDDDDDDSDDEDGNDEARMTLHKTLLEKSESIQSKSTSEFKAKDEKLLRVISKTKVNLEF